MSQSDLHSQGVSSAFSSTRRYGCMYPETMSSFSNQWVEGRTMSAYSVVSLRKVSAATKNSTLSSERSCWMMVFCSGELLTQFPLVAKIALIGYGTDPGTLLVVFLVPSVARLKAGTEPVVIAWYIRDCGSEEAEVPDGVSHP